MWHKSSSAGYKSTYNTGLYSSSNTSSTTRYRSKSVDDTLRSRSYRSGAYASGSRYNGAEARSNRNSAVTGGSDRYRSTEKSFGIADRSAGGGGGGGDKSTYRVVGRITRTPSPRRARSSSELVLPSTAALRSSKDVSSTKVTSTSYQADIGLAAGGGYASGERGRDKYRTYSPVEPRGRYTGRRSLTVGGRGDDSYRRSSGGAAGRSKSYVSASNCYPTKRDDGGNDNDYSKWDKDGRGRSSSSYPSKDAGGYGDDSGGNNSGRRGRTKDVRFSRDLPSNPDREACMSVRRARSLDDLNGGRSGRGGAGGKAGITFPVCSRYPNCSVCVIDIPQNEVYKDNVIQTMQHEAKEENEYVIVIEKKDKEIHLKSETISQITQILERTKKELQVKSVECQRHELTVSQLREELKNCVSEKKQIETRHNEQQVYVTKYEVSETQLSQLNAKYEECVTHNRELIERIKELEISEKEFIVLEKNLIELQVQLRDMEDVEVHRDELMHKLGFVKKQRDEFLEKGRLVEEERNEFVRSNKTLEQYIIEWKRKTAEFKKTNQALKDRILCLEKDKKELEGRVVEVQTERAQLQASLQKVEVERDDLCREFREVTMERNALEARVMDLEDLLSDHDHLEEGFHSLRLKVAELTRQRDDAEMLIPTYKTKVQSLKKHLREKEDNIMQLTHDIKKLTLSIENQTYIDLREIKSLSTINYESKKNRSNKKKESSKIEVVNYFHDKPPSPPSSGADSYEEVLINPVSDTYSDVPDPLRPVRGVRKYIALFDYDPKRKRELRLREGDYVTIYGDIDTDGFYMGEVRGVRGLVPSVYIEESSEDDSSVGYSRTGVRYVTGGSRDRKFIALYDYDPYTMGTTDRPDLQLSLSKGDEMIVVGDIDVDGYYTALQNGKRCLVPSNFVREISTKTQQQSSSSHRVTSDSRHVSPNSRHQNNVNTSATFEGTIELDDVVGPPYAPEDVKVQRVVTRNAVLLGWRLPVIDEYGRSNRCKVTGYRIWVNGKPKQDIKSPSVTKALVDGLDLHGRVEFSVQTVGENGFCSEKCHFAITGALSALSKDNEWHQQSECDLYVALYDYDPFKSSPNPNPSLELKLNEGDLVKVTDKSRSDGFFFGEIKGSKGLVPSNFIEQVNGSSVRKS